MTTETGQTAPQVYHVAPFLNSESRLGIIPLDLEEDDSSVLSTCVKVVGDPGVWCYVPEGWPGSVAVTKTELDPTYYGNPLPEGPSVWKEYMVPFVTSIVAQRTVGEPDLSKPKDLVIELETKWCRARSTYPTVWVAEFKTLVNGAKMLGDEYIPKQVSLIRKVDIEKTKVTTSTKEGTWLRVPRHWPGAEILNDPYATVPELTMWDQHVFLCTAIEGAPTDHGLGHYFYSEEMGWLRYIPYGTFDSAKDNSKPTIISAKDIEGSLTITADYLDRYQQQSPQVAQLEVKEMSAIGATGHMLKDAAKTAAIRVAVNEACEGILDVVAEAGKDIPAVAALLETNLGRQMILLLAVSGVHFAAEAGLTSLAESDPLQPVGALRWRVQLVAATVAENAIAAAMGPEAEKLRKALTQSAALLTAVELPALVEAVEEIEKKEKEKS